MQRLSQVSCSRSHTAARMLNFEQRMGVPVQLTFRDIPHSDALAAHAEKRAIKLETFNDHIVKCHVVLEAPHRHHKHGKRYHVRVDLHVPGKTLCVSKNLED